MSRALVRLALAAAALTVASPGVAVEPPIPRERLVLAVERGPGAARGRTDAPVTLVEFSDFQCSFCRRFWRETLPRIEAEYIATGKVRFVYRHLVVLGAASSRAAQAAECAREQGKFWRYHDLLFELGPSAGFTDATFTEFAEDLGLDTRAFGTCLASGRHADRVLAESAVARRLGASGTPSFLINGRLLIGAQPFEAFTRVLDAELVRAAAPRAPTR